MEPDHNQKMQANPVDAVGQDESPFPTGLAEVIPAAPSENNTRAEEVDFIQNFAPGYRFVPTNIELVCEYLEKKIRNLPVPNIGIRDVNLYGGDNPQILAERYPPLGDDEWYFFTPRERKYPNGSRPNRAAGTGYWKATGADINIKLNHKIIGYKKTLVFYDGKSPKGVKTNWTMHEFTINQPPRSRRNAQDMRLDDWVLCRISKKVPKPKENQQDEVIDPVDAEEEDNIPVVDNNVGHQPPAVEVQDNVATTNALTSFRDDTFAFLTDQGLQSTDFRHDNVVTMDAPIVYNNHNHAVWTGQGDHVLGIGQDRIAAVENPDGLINRLGDPPAWPDLHPQVPYNSMEGSSFTHFGLDSGNGLQTSYDHGMPNPFGQPQSVFQNDQFLDDEAWRLLLREDFIQQSFWDSQNHGTSGPFFSYSGPSSSSSTLYDPSLKIEDGFNDVVRIPDNNNNDNPMTPRKRTRLP